MSDLKKVQNPKHGDLRVWWIPQVPMKAFRQEVASVIEGRLLLDALARYDLFQLENKIRPDFSNVGGLEVFDKAENDWIDWHDDETDDDIDGFTLAQLRGKAKK